MKSQITIQDKLDMAKEYVSNSQYKSAIDTYEEIIKLCDNSVAYYNLGVLYATGRGVKRNKIIANSYFCRSYKNCNKESNSLITRCKHSYLKELMELDAGLVKLLSFPSIDCDAIIKAGKTLCEYGNIKYKLKQYDVAFNAYKSAAEICFNSEAEFNLGLMFLNGKGVEKSDIYALYWFDKAADSGISEARKYSESIFMDYFKNKSQQKFYELIDSLIEKCRKGCEAFSKDFRKEIFWSMKKFCILNKTDFQLYHKSEGTE